MAAIRLLVGLGNPGAQYRDTRHNAGVWLVEAWLRLHGDARPQEVRKFFGATTDLQLKTARVRVLLPGTYVNDSGRSVQALAGYYRIPAEDILIAHDELDLPAGTVRFKSGGGAGGHNGLKDIMRVLGGGFARVRIGVGHPGSASRVVKHVLARPGADEQERIRQSIEEALPSLDRFIAGDRQGAMLRQHTGQHTGRTEPSAPDAGDAGR